MFILYVQTRIQLLWTWCYQRRSISALLKISFQVEKKNHQQTKQPFPHKKDLSLVSTSFITDPQPPNSEWEISEQSQNTHWCLLRTVQTQAGWVPGPAEYLQESTGAFNTGINQKNISIMGFFLSKCISFEVLHISVWQFFSPGFLLSHSNCTKCEIASVLLILQPENWHRSFTDFHKSWQQQLLLYPHLIAFHF